MTATVELTPTLESTPEMTATLALSSAAVESDLAAAGDGLAVYRQQYCGTCHELTAAGTRGTFGPTHNSIGTTAAQRIQSAGYSGHATTAAEYIRESLLDPQSYLVEGYGATLYRMPPYGYLDSASLDALVAFLLSQS
jgi:mono/diheme cytochrome c family protein